MIKLFDVEASTYNFQLGRTYSPVFRILRQMSIELVARYRNESYFMDEVIQMRMLLRTVL